MSPTVDAVRAHYDHFPYPSVASLSRPQPRGFKIGVLNFLLRKREADALRDDGRIWIAGCGTQQAAHWGLSLPGARFLATDVSEETLAIAESLCRELGLDNIRFARHDLLEPCPAGPFDLIVSTGVVHHLPDPLSGLLNLRTALSPGGAMVLMVYSRMHREPLAVLRRTIRVLAGPEADLDERYELGLRLIEQELGSPSCSPPCPGALQLLRERRKDRSFVSDCLLHPLEHSYDIDDLLALLAGAGLRHSSWIQPARWTLAPYLDDDDLSARFLRLSEVDRWRTVYNVAGHSGPLLELVAEHSDAQVQPPYELREVLAMRLVLRRGREIFRVEEGRITNHIEEPSFIEEDGMIIAKGPGAFGPTESWRLPAHALPLIKAFDGKCSVAEIAEKFANEFAQREILELIGTLSPYDIGLLAPVFS